MSEKLKMRLTGQLAIEVEKKKKVIETHEWVEIKGE